MLMRRVEAAASAAPIPKLSVGSSQCALELMPVSNPPVGCSGHIPLQHSVMVITLNRNSAVRGSRTGTLSSRGTSSERRDTNSSEFEEINGRELSEYPATKTGQCISKTRRSTVYHSGLDQLVYLVLLYC